MAFWVVVARLVQKFCCKTEVNKIKRNVLERILGCVIFREILTMSHQDVVQLQVPVDVARVMNLLEYVNDLDPKMDDTHQG